MVIRPLPHPTQDLQATPTQAASVRLGQLGARSVEMLAPGPARARGGGCHVSGAPLPWDRHGAIEAAPEPRLQRQG